MKPSRIEIGAALDMIRDDVENMDENEFRDFLEIYEIAIQNGILKGKK